jgi:DNA repair photolyase
MTNSNFQIEQLTENLFVQRATKRATFNKTDMDSGIEWAKWSWNPVTGCLFGCPYCYAKKMAESGFFAKGFPKKFKPTFHPDRLSAPDHHKIPAKQTTHR